MNKFFQNPNMPYYPEDFSLPQQEPKTTIQSNPTANEPRENPLASILNNMENVKGNNLVSMLLSSGAFAGFGQNNMLMQTLTNVLNSPKTSQQKEKSLNQITFEEF